MMAAARIAGPCLSQLLAGIAAVPPALDRDIAGLALDSRRVRPGDCFLALKGSAQHGASFARDAIAAGAVAVLVEDLDIPPVPGAPIIPVAGLRAATGRIAARFYGAPSAGMDIIAVTGTNGKTTVAHLCAQALTHLRGSCGYLGTLGYGLLTALAPGPNTTPDPITLQHTLAALRDAGSDAAALEASSHALAQERLNDLAIDVAVFTGLGHDHLDYHGSLAAYAEAKKSLFRLPGVRHAVLNIDHPLSAEIAATLAAGVEGWAYTLKPGAVVAPRCRAVVLEEAVLTLEESRLRLRTPAGRAVIHSTLVGDFNAENLLAALAALLALGTPLAAACAALSAAVPVPGRMEVLGGEAGMPRVFVDYAHTPDSLERVLAMLARQTTGRIVCVFGCGGDRDRAKRPLMGEIAERYAAQVLVTSDNPRSEDNAAIAAAILAGTRAPQRLRVIHDRAAAIQAAIAAAGAGDVVLVAGKGHEDTQTIGAVKTQFSDVAVVRRVLAERHHD